MTKLNSIAWIIGYFVCLYPMNYATDGSILLGLATGILGLVVAIALMNLK